MDDAANSAGIYMRWEPKGVDPDSRQRPDGLAPGPTPTYVDIQIKNPLAPSYIDRACTQHLAAAKIAEQGKASKYRDLMHKLRLAAGC